MIRALLLAIVLAVVVGMLSAHGVLELVREKELVVGGVTIPVQVEHDIYLQRDVNLGLATCGVVAALLGFGISMAATRMVGGGGGRKRR